MALLSRVTPLLKSSRPAHRPPGCSSTAALALVEVMVAMFLMAIVMLGFINSFLQSRRLTESSVLQAAATSLIYGTIEQMKGLSYTDLLPSTGVDPDAPADVRDFPPYVRLRINQDVTKWLRVVYTKAPDAPKGPATTPAITATAADVGAIDNYLGNIPLSTVTGTASQDLALNVWIWIDETPDDGKDVSEVKKVTVVYTYSYIDGAATRVVRNREVFLRTQYEQ